MHTGAEEFKPGAYVHISTVYFPFLKIFLIKKKYENDQGNGGFSDVTSKQLNFEHKLLCESNKTIDITYLV